MSEHTSDYYTAREARDVLGLNENTFQTWIKTGKIPRTKLRGMRRGVYAKRDIDALSRAMNMAIEPYERMVFSKSTPGDQEEEMYIGIRCFGGEFITSLPERIGFQQKSEFTFYSLKVDGHVVGYISMFHLPPTFLDDLLTGKRIERDITLKEVLKFPRLEPFDIYIGVLAVDPNLSAHERHLYAGIIVSRFANLILHLRDNGYLIRTVYVVSATKEGDNLIRKVGFRLIPGKSIAPGRLAYEFPLDDQGIQRLQELTGRKFT
jgi:hypothetical protein